MKIGVAIPCFDKHIPYLFLLLDSIEVQTVHPDKVCVSCSSTAILPPSKKYSFPLEIILTKDKRNAAQNRNIATSQLRDMDYITFMDADDIMHPQRIEILRNIFKEHQSDMILHNYQDGSNTLFKPIQYVNVRFNTLKPTASGGITHIEHNKYLAEKIHHSQVSIKRSILDMVEFPESPEYCRREDSAFCHRVIGLKNIKHVYVVNELSYYKPSNTVF